MADYGLTPQGPNIKRLDVILEEMHSGLSPSHTYYLYPITSYRSTRVCAIKKRI